MLNEPGSDPPADLSLSERKEATEASPWNTDTGSTHFGEVLLTYSTGADKCPFEILPLAW